MKNTDNEAGRVAQLAYSELQHKTHDEQKRRRKAAKIVRVLQDFLGAQSLEGQLAVDIGCSTGYTAKALHDAGAKVIGLDIDVPGLVHAKAAFGDSVSFLCADGSRLPFPDRSVGILVFNHIYEHVVDADAVLTEISRVLSDDGVVYLALGNRLNVIEPHYRLPFLSWLPRGAADRYVAATKRAPNYYEKFRTRRGLLSMCASLNLWDYTYTVLANSEQFAAQDMVPRRLAGAPGATWHLLSPIMPTFIWLGTVGDRRPASSAQRERPKKIAVATPVTASPDRTGEPVTPQRDASCLP